MPGGAVREPFDSYSLPLIFAPLQPCNSTLLPKLLAAASSGVPSFAMARHLLFGRLCFRRLEQESTDAGRGRKVSPWWNLW